MGDERAQAVLLLAAGRDRTLTRDLLRQAGFECYPCQDPEALCHEIQAGAGAVLLAEEFLTRDSVQLLVETLRRQPPWSELPILIVAREEERSADLLKASRVLGAVMILPRPIPLDTLLSAVEAALSSRRRQYEVRDLLRMREETDRRKDEFLAMLGHELRNPLSPVLNAAHVLRLGRQQDTFVQRHVEVIERHTRHLAGIVDDLLDVARITHGKVRLQKQRLRMDHIVEQAVETCRAVLQERGHQLTVTLPEEPVWLEADALRLVQILSNLLNNAAKYTEPGGHIWLTVQVAQGRVEVTVRDTGIGIAPDLLPHIFETFVQAPRVLDRAQGGLGLGLSMVRLLAEMHGGSVVAHSAGLGQGSEFVVRLPAAAPPAEAAAPPADLPREASSVMPPEECPALVVDDNGDAAETLAELLTLWGYPVEVANDGLAALEIARRIRPRVVLLDLNMPGKDGYEVARELRRDVCRGSEVIVALTGFAQEETRRRVLEAGFNYHLVKPIDPEALHQLLAAAAQSY